MSAELDGKHAQPVTVREFMDAGAQALKLELISGEKSKIDLEGI